MSANTFFFKLDPSSSIRQACLSSPAENVTKPSGVPSRRSPSGLQICGTSLSFIFPHPQHLKLKLLAKKLAKHAYSAHQGHHHLNQRQTLSCLAQMMSSNPWGTSYRGSHHDFLVSLSQGQATTAHLSLLLTTQGCYTLFVAQCHNHFALRSATIREYQMPKIIILVVGKVASIHSLGSVSPQ